MIVEYQRPSTLEEAILLLKRDNPKSVPMGGGTILSKKSRDDIAVVDLQSLGMDNVKVLKDQVVIGATATLQKIMDTPGIPQFVAQNIQLEATWNIRNVGTLAGTLLSVNGQSVLAATLLAFNAVLVWEPCGIEQQLEGFYENRTAPKNCLLIKSISLDPGIKINGETVRKTPRDLPLLSIYISKEPSGKERIILGGACDIPFVYKSHEKQLSLDDAYLRFKSRILPKDYFLSTIPILITRVREVVK